MKPTKGTEDVFSHKVARAQRMGEEIDKVRVVVDKFDGEFWAAICDRLEKRLRIQRDRRAENFLKMSEIELKADLASEEAIKAVMAMPAEYKENLIMMQKMHDDLAKEIREYRDRVKADQ